MIQTPFSAVLIQLWLALLAVAAPAEIYSRDHGHGNVVGYGTGGGILGLIVLIVDIIIFST